MDQKEALRWMAEVFQAPANSLTPDTLSSEVAGWDSLGMLMLIAALDERFGIQMDESELYGVKGVRDILELLERVGALAPASAAA